MAKGELLGEFECVVLAAVLRCGENAYGMTVFDAAEDILSGHRTVSLGSVYTTLDRLEEKGYVQSTFGEATKERGGRPKRFFDVTGSGQTAFRNSFRVAKAAFASMEGAWTKP
jgi:PadR family transcriptional regulator, regulatory protein PadR